MPYYVYARSPGAQLERIAGARPVAAGDSRSIFRSSSLSKSRSPRHRQALTTPVCTVAIQNSPAPATSTRPARVSRPDRRTWNEPRRTFRSRAVCQSFQVRNMPQPAIPTAMSIGMTL